jgi:hypothetical protein
MTTTSKLAALALALTLPAAALAAAPNGPDDAYCRALADSYVRYIGYGFESPRGVRNQGSLDGQVAVAQCREGKASEAIPVLERELTNAKVPLPGRG